MSEQRIAELEAALKEAIELAEEGWAYASDYFVKKWGFIEERNKLAAIVGLPPFDAEPTMEGHGERPVAHGRMA